MPQVDTLGRSIRRCEVYDLYLATVLGIARVSSRSLALKRAMVSLMAGAAGVAPSRKRDRIRVAVARTFPDLSQHERRRIEREALRTTWTEILSWAPCAGEIAEWRQALVSGAEHLENALGRGRGVVLWESTGFGHREPVKQWLVDHGRAPVQVHGPNALGNLLVSDLGSSRFRTETLRPAFEALERRRVAEILTLSTDGPSVGVLRAVGRHLGQNGVVLITADGAEGRRVNVRLLGRDELFATAIPNLVRSSGSSLLPVFCWRAGDGGLRVEFEEPLAAGASDKAEAIREMVETYVKRLEARILDSPGQYRNWHLLGDTA